MGMGKLGRARCAVPLVSPVLSQTTRQEAPPRRREAILHPRQPGVFQAFIHAFGEPARAESVKAWNTFPIGCNPSGRADIQSFRSFGNHKTLLTSYGLNHKQSSQFSTTRLKMRPEGRLKAGFFPLPLAEAERIRRFLQFEEGHTPALDPCVGEGAALAVIASGRDVTRYGIELDAYRAERARTACNEIIQGNALDVTCAVGSFSLIYENPPYDWEIGESR